MKSIAELKVADIMSSQVFSLRPSQRVDEAVQCMAEHRMSCLVVVDEAMHPQGILTERDIVRLMHQQSTRGTLLQEVMTTPVLTVGAQMDFRAAYALLRKHHVRHLVVTDGTHRTLGIVSETDFRKHLGRDVFRKIQSLTSAIDRDLLSMGPDNTLADALARMVSARWDYVIVTQDCRPLGIITERDIPRLLAAHVDPQAVSLREVMSAPILTVAPTASVGEVIGLMGKHRVRHMAVVDAQGCVGGVISQHHLLELLGVEIIEDTLTKEHGLEREKRKLENRLQLVLDATEVGVWELEHASSTQTWNSTAHTLLGYAPGTLPSTLSDWIALIHPDDRSVFMQALHTGTPGEPSVFTAEYRVRLGHSTPCKPQWLWLNHRGRVVEYDSFGNPARSVAVLTNVSERHEAEEALRQATQAAQVASRAKSEFLATMSHELRTPMNAILGMTGLVCDITDDPDLRRYLRDANGAARQLLDVLNDILDYTGMEGGDVALRVEPFDIYECVGDCLEHHTAAAHDKGLRLMGEIDDHLPADFCGDVTRVNQILNTLLGNAIKFTPAGEVRLEVAVDEVSRPGNHVRIAVKDTGIGIAPEHHRSIFEPFSQADGSATRRFGGIGLGLAICHRLVRAMDGEIRLTSTPGEGSCFEVWLPIVPPDYSEFDF